MRLILVYLLGIITSLTVMAQEKSEMAVQTLFEELALEACLCIDEVEVENKNTEDFMANISSCIHSQVAAYQLGKHLGSLDLAALSGEGNEVTLEINNDSDSENYRREYQVMQRYLMERCPVLKDKISISDKRSEASFSKNDQALDYYNQGLELLKTDNLKEALTLFKKAVETDKEFAFAWDKIGIVSRKLGDFDQAILAYEKSLEIDPSGMMPLQNLGVTYQYKEDYKKALEAFSRFAVQAPHNPEAFYGLGMVYILNLEEFEKGLDAMCKAYNLYIEQDSPYSVDAEKWIQHTYVEMDKMGDKGVFIKILEDNNIHFSE